MRRGAKYRTGNDRRRWLQDARIFDIAGIKVSLRHLKKGITDYVLLAELEKGDDSEEAEWARKKELVKKFIQTAFIDLRSDLDNQQYFRDELERDQTNACTAKISTGDMNGNEIIKAEIARLRAAFPPLKIPPELESIERRLAESGEQLTAARDELKIEAAKARAAGASVNTPKMNALDSRIREINEARKSLRVAREAEGAKLAPAYLSAVGAASAEGVELMGGLLDLIEDAASIYADANANCGRYGIEPNKVMRAGLWLRGMAREARRNLVG